MGTYYSANIAVLCKPEDVTSIFDALNRVYQMDEFNCKRSYKTYTSLLRMSFWRVRGEHELLGALYDCIEKLSKTFQDAKFKMDKCITSGDTYVKSMIMQNGNFIKGIGLQDGWALDEVYDSKGENVSNEKWDEYIDRSAFDEYGDGAMEAFFKDFIEGHEDLISN